MEQEIAILSRVVANHLFLGQFEALRASLLSLRKRNPELALSILRSIVLQGGRIDGVLWSSTCISPSQLAWLSALELINFDNSGSIWRFDPEILVLKVEFLLLIQLVSSKVSEMLKNRPQDPDLDEKEETLDVNIHSVEILNKILGLGVWGLKADAEHDVEIFDEGSLVSDDELRGLWRIFLDNGEVFDALCGNIQSQAHPSGPYGSELAISVRAEAVGTPSSSLEESEVLGRIQRSVQMAHLDALKEAAEKDDLDGAFSHLRFLHQGYGVQETEYKMVMQVLIKKAWSQNAYYGETWMDARNKMMLMYVEALSSSCMQLVQMIQVIHDEVLSQEIEQHRISDPDLIPLPLKKYLTTLALENVTNLQGETASIAIRSCMRDLYHYARISGTHVLECTMHAALSAIRREQLQEASDILSLFPLLRPLVAVLGWDLLSGKTAARKKMMQLLWTSKSQVLRLEEFPHYGKQSDVISCVEYLCDLLCFHLDLSFFVACVNSGQSWNLKNSLLFSQKEQVVVEHEPEVLDPFVENFILERLAVQTPMRVLFDVVPGIKFQDAIKLISMQPIASTSAAWKRCKSLYALASV